MLPNLIIIGAMKCATTSLHAYLDLHPEISMSREKELDFFVDTINWERGVEWYSRQFPTEARVLGEASPRYTMRARHPGVPARMASVIPDASLIYLVRDPLDRLVSHHIHRAAREVVPRPIQELVQVNEDNLDVSAGRYAWQLDAYLEHFDRNRVLVVKQEDLRRDQMPTLRRIFRFLGVHDDLDPNLFAFEFHNSRNKARANPAMRLFDSVSRTALVQWVPHSLRTPLRALAARVLSKPVEKPRLPDELRRRLIEFYTPDVRRLRELTGLSFDDWSVTGT